MNERMSSNTFLRFSCFLNSVAKMLASEVIPFNSHVRPRALHLQFSKSLTDNRSFVPLVWMGTISSRASCCTRDVAQVAAKADLGFFNESEKWSWSCRRGSVAKVIWTALCARHGGRLKRSRHSDRARPATTFNIVSDIYLTVMGWQT